MMIYNEILRIERCLNSLKMQNIDFVCVISDNRSNDGTFSILNKELHLDPRFVVIQPEKHLGQVDHYLFLCDFVFSNIQNSQYVMTLGGDDELQSKDYLASLSDWLDQNSNYQIVSPQIINHNISLGTTSLVVPQLCSKYGFTRLLKFSTKSSRSGFTNFVNGLMRTHTYLNYYKSWAYYGDLEKVPESQRKIRTEFAVFVDLVRLRRIGACSSVRLLKEVGNRDSNGNRKSLVGKAIYSELPKRNSGFLANLNHQIKNMLIPFNAFLYFKNQISTIQNVYLLIYACLSLIVNLNTLIVYKLNKLLKSFI